MVVWLMNNELEGTSHGLFEGTVPAFAWRDRVKLWKTNKSQNSQWPYEDSNSASPEYKSEVLTLEPTCSLYEHCF
jgi:hypothetical protein